MFKHRYLKQLTCRVVEMTRIGYKVIEFDKVKKVSKEAVFGFLDFDPVVSWWGMDGAKE